MARTKNRRKRSGASNEAEEVDRIQTLRTFRYHAKQFKLLPDDNKLPLINLKHN